MESSSSTDTKDGPEIPFYFSSLDDVQNVLYRSDASCSSPTTNLDTSNNFAFDSIKREIHDISNQFKSRFQSGDQTVEFENIFLSRAPGRVNLLGEHIDYNGYGVLPFAISKHVMILGGIGRSGESNLEGVQIENMDYLKYKGVKFQNCIDFLDLPEKAEIQILSTSEMDKSGSTEFVSSNISSLPIWIRYIVCGYKGVVEYLKKYCSDSLHDENKSKTVMETKNYTSKSTITIDDISKKMTSLNGLKLLVFGSIPPASGLSSSSALVVASATFFLSILGVQALLTRSELAQLCAECEKYIGTVGGGMDQAVSLLARENTALNIEFNPLKVNKVVPLQNSFRIVIANSLTTSEKAVRANIYFNKRVLECKLGLFMLAKYMEMSGVLLRNSNQNKNNWTEFQSIHAIEEALESNSLPITIEILKECFHDQPYSFEEARTVLFPSSSPENSEEQKAYINEQFLSLFPEKLQEIVCEVENSGQEFPLHIFHRMVHVLSEKARVRCFVDKALHIPLNDNEVKLACFPSLQWGLNAGEWLNSFDCKTHVNHELITMENTDQSEVLGVLMNMSHESCRAFYDCSCKELNDLVQVCRNHKYCLGSRLTGAGWGGCCISLVRESEVDNFIEMLTRDYYETVLQKTVEKNNINEYIFVSSPGTGSWCSMFC